MSNQDDMDAVDQDVDMIVAEWATYGEYEVFAAVYHGEYISSPPVIQLNRVAHDGEVLFGIGGLALTFESVADFREFLEERFPLDTARI